MKTLLAVAMTLLISASSFAQTVVVTGNTSAGENQPGWLFNRDASTSTPFQFVDSNPKIGVGSLYVQPIQNNVPGDKFIAEYFINKAISEIDSFSFDFRLGATVPSSATHQFYLNAYANFAVSGPFKFYDCRYNVVASVGSSASYSTLTFDPTAPYSVTQSGSSPNTCPSVPADMGPGATIRVFAINVGDSTASDQNVSGYLDNVVVATTDGGTTFDFEPALTPTSAEQCKKGGWMTFNTPSFPNQGACVSFVVSNSPNN